jgi:hypothetical protein
MMKKIITILGLIFLFTGTGNLSAQVRTQTQLFNINITAWTFFFILPGTPITINSLPQTDNSSSWNYRSNQLGPRVIDAIITTETGGPAQGTNYRLYVTAASGASTGTSMGRINLNKTGAQNVITALGSTGVGTATGTLTYELIELNGTPQFPTTTDCSILVTYTCHN